MVDEGPDGLAGDVGADDFHPLLPFRSDVGEGLQFVRRADDEQLGEMQVADAAAAFRLVQVVLQHLLARAFCFPPVSDEEEIVGLQLQLSALRIGPVDDHQNQPLGVPPGLGSIKTEVDHVLVAFTRRSTDRPRKVNPLSKIPHRVLKNSQAVATGVLFAGPAGMLGGIDVPLGVRHQAEDAAGFVADSGDVPLGTVGVRGVGEERAGGRDCRFEI